MSLCFIRITINLHNSSTITYFILYIYIYIYKIKYVMVELLCKLIVILIKQSDIISVSFYKISFTFSSQFTIYVQR